MDGIASRSGTHRMSHVAAAVFQERPATELPARLALILNLKENGYLHLASRASMHQHRDRRRAHCGWRAGSSAAHVRFISTKVWPPLGSEKSRICSKCFPNRKADSRALAALVSDPVEQTD
jgi:peptide methionine sulfoxide reductase MsrB